MRLQKQVKPMRFAVSSHSAGVGLLRRGGAPAGFVRFCRIGRQSTNVLWPEKSKFERAISDEVVAQVGFARFCRCCRVLCETGKELGEGGRVKCALAIGRIVVILLTPCRTWGTIGPRSSNDAIIGEDRARSVNGRDDKGRGVPIDGRNGRDKL